MNYLGPILALGVLIIVHEAGHFFVARWCGMRVERFSIGFGPAIAKWRSKRGSLFQLAPIPFGGFVEIKGMNIAEDVDPVLAERHAEVHSHPLDPGLEILVLGLGREDLGLVAEPLEVRELARLDELLHQYR